MKKKFSISTRNNKSRDVDNAAIECTAHRGIEKDKKGEDKGDFVTIKRENIILIALHRLGASILA